MLKWTYAQHWNKPLVVIKEVLGFITTVFKKLKVIIMLYNHDSQKMLKKSSNQQKKLSIS